MAWRKRNNREASLSSDPDDLAAASSASSPAPDYPAPNKKAKFEERYNMEESSDTDVLCEFSTA
jgi:hypothetical protein